jgi:hypothetical protein
MYKAAIALNWSLGKFYSLWKSFPLVTAVNNSNSDLKTGNILLSEFK